MPLFDSKMTFGPYKQKSRKILIGTFSIIMYNVNVADIIPKFGSIRT